MKNLCLDGDAQSTVPWSIPALRLCGLCSMARYLYGMLQDCTVCSVPVVNKEPFYKKVRYRLAIHRPSVEPPARRVILLCQSELQLLWSSVLWYAVWGDYSAFVVKICCPNVLEHTRMTIRTINCGIQNFWRVTKGKYLLFSDIPLFLVW